MTSSDFTFYTCALPPGRAAGISRSYIHVPEQGSSLAQRAAAYAISKSMHARIGNGVERDRRLPQ